MSTQLSDIRTHAGLAGQVSVTFTVTYNHTDPETGEPSQDGPWHGEFVGSTYGGPVVAISHDTGAQTFVSDPSRFGEFGNDPVKWARAFYEIKD